MALNAKEQQQTAERLDNLKALVENLNRIHTRPDLDYDTKAKVAEASRVSAEAARKVDELLV